MIRLFRQYCFFPTQAKIFGYHIFHSYPRKLGFGCFCHCFGISRMTNKGNKRNKMKTIQGTDARQAALPKPRSDLFTRASELCTLCGVETALVIFSPGGSSLTFGHPFVNSATFKLCQHVKLDAETIRKLEAHQEAVLRKLHNECADLRDKIEAEKKRGKKL